MATGDSGEAEPGEVDILPPEEGSDSFVRSIALG